MTNESFLLKISDGPTSQTYRTVAGVSADHISISAQSLSVTGHGIFTDKNAEKLIQAITFSGLIKSYQFIFDGEKIVRGMFKIERLEYAGNFNGQRRYTIQLESDGAVSLP